MAQQEAAKALANILNKVTRYSVLLGIGGSALQASLYTGKKTKKGSCLVVVVLIILSHSIPSSFI